MIDVNGVRSSCETDNTRSVFIASSSWSRRFCSSSIASRAARSRSASRRDRQR